MKTLIVVANPGGTASFCGAIASTAAEVLRTPENEVIVHDLYAENFNPILTQEEIQTSCEQVTGPLLDQINELLEADTLIFVHPNWWGMPPAILTGWIDRVIRQGFCYAFTANGPITKLDGKRLFVFTTANTPDEIEQKLNHDPLRNLWTNIIPSTVGIKDIHYLCFSSVIMSDDNQRKAWLDEVKQALQQPNQEK